MMSVNASVTHIPTSTKKGGNGRRFEHQHVLRGIWLSFLSSPIWSSLSSLFEQSVRQLSQPSTADEIGEKLGVFGLHSRTSTSSNVRLSVLSSLFRALPLLQGVGEALDRDVVYSLTNTCQRFLDCTLPLPLSAACVIQKPTEHRVTLILELLNAMERKFGIQTPFVDYKLLQPSALYFASLQMIVEDIQQWETLRVRGRGQDKGKVFELGETVRGWIALFNHKSVDPSRRNSSPVADECMMTLVKRSPFVVPLEPKLMWIRSQTRPSILSCDGAREDVQPIVFKIRRDSLLKDALQQFRNAKRADLRSRPLKVEFDGEEAIDVRGVRREFITLLSRALFQTGDGPSLASGQRKGFPLFEEAANNCIRPAARLKREAMYLYELAGIVMAKALLEGDVLDASLSSYVFKRLLGRKVVHEDLAAVDPSFYKNQVEWIRDNRVDGIVYETFTVESGGKTVELCRGGKRKDVTDKNKFEYLDLLVEYKLVGESENHLQTLFKAFHSILRPELVQILTEEELEIALCGRPSVDPKELLDHTTFSNGYDRDCMQIKALEELLMNGSDEIRSTFLHFVTGCSRLPAGGVRAFAPPFKIQRVLDKSRLPSASTCFNLLKLPAYDTPAQLESKLRLVLNDGSQGFGLS
mmetsp:Transcript_44558/g.115878  ORF Transcript_44558/g.115878 Transcript_44558/m.115878 type:complete len:639 (-) Transcript_44558:231-2147(-)